MKGKIIMASEIKGRLFIETDQTFKVCDSEGNESDGNGFSIGTKTAIQALMGSPFGALIAAKCAGNPKDYEGVTNVLVYVLCGANVEFSRTKLNAGDKRADGIAVEKPCYQTAIASITSVADMGIFMQLLPMIAKKAVTTTAVNPFI